MFNSLYKWWFGELIEVEIVERKTQITYPMGSMFCDHTLVKLPDNTIRYIYGHIGHPGDKITVNTWELQSY